MKRRWKKRLGSLLLALCMVVTLLPGTAFAGDTTEEYSYIDENGVQQTADIDSANIIDNNWDYRTNRLTDGWYVVTGTVTVGDGGYGLTVDGDVHLILPDAAVLTASSGVYIRSGSLSIYGQALGTGSLTALGGEAISTGDFGRGSLAIYGAAVSATGSSYGIRLEKGLTISGGRVTATGNTAVWTDSVTVSGGAVTARSTRGEAYDYGIAASATLTISGGTVTATGGEYGLKSYANSIAIGGGSVNATVSVQPKNSTDDAVYKTTLLLPEAGPYASVSGTVSSAGYYKFNGVKTDGEGSAYLWLPAGEATVNLTAGAQTYDGTLTVNTDGSTRWPLRARTVTFDPKGGTVSGDSTALTDGNTGCLASLPEADLDGYDFKGWYSAYYGGEKITTATAFELDATVYARWEKTEGAGETPDTWKIDVSKLTVNHAETSATGPVWGYSAANKTLTVTGDTLTLTGTNSNLHVNVTKAGADLTLSGASISAGTMVKNALRFSAGPAEENTLTLAAGTENTLSGGDNTLNSGVAGLFADSKLTLAGDGKLTVVSTADWTAAIDINSTALTVDGPAVVANGCFFGLSMGVNSVSSGTLEITAGGLTLNRTDNHYSHVLDTNYDTGLTVNVGAGAALTVNGGDTYRDTTINNYGGTVYIDGNVNGTANNDDEAGGIFTVTGGVAHSNGTISKPVLAAVTINLATLEQSGTEYYELVPGAENMVSQASADLTGYTVIRIKKPGDFTITGTAPPNHVLLDGSSSSVYTLSGCSIDGLAYSTRAVTVTGTNTVGSQGIPLAGGTNAVCSYSGSGTLKLQNSAGEDLTDGAFPGDENGTAVLNGCAVEISGFAYAGDGIRINSGSLKTDGHIFKLEMFGGSAEVQNSKEPDAPIIVDYTAGRLLLQGKLDTLHSDEPQKAAIFNTNGGSFVSNVYLWSYDSYQVSAPAAPEKDGHRFTGWYTDTELNTSAAFPAALTGVQNYYAAWGEVTKTQVTISGLTAQNAVYNGAAHSGYTGTAASGAYNGALVYSYAGRDETVYAASSAKPVNAGSYTVTISVPDTDEDYMGSASLDFVIAKRPVTVKAGNKTMTTGGSLPAFTYTVDGQLSGETALTGTPTVTSAADGQTAGSFPISVDMAGVTGYTANYEAAVPAFVNGTLTVSAKSSGGDGGGGGGSAGTTPAEQPKTDTTVSGNTATATATATATVNSSGTATASVTQAQISEAIAKAAEAAAKQGGDTAAVVEIKVTAPANAKAVETSIPQASIQALASGGVDALTITSGVSSVSFDADALAAISRASSGDVTVSASRADVSTLPAAAQALIGNRPVYDFTVTSGGKTISQFGGAVTVSLPYTPAAGEDPNAIIVHYINDSGNLETVMNGRYDAASGTVVFTTDHFSRYAVGYHKVSFNDVKSSAWYSEAVSFIAAREITTGTGGSNYSPGAKLTRGEFTVMLMKAYGIEPDSGKAGTEGSDANFADAGNTWYTGYLAAAKRLGISDGVGDNLFAPGKAITRQEMFTLLYNALEAIGELPDGNTGKPLSSFSDAGQIASWAKDAMALMAETGTVSGSEGKLAPKETTTRAQMAQVLYNLMSE